MKIKEEISMGVRGHHQEILKVEPKICAIWGILEANLKKCSTLTFMMNISFVPSICIHRSTTLIWKNNNKKTHACPFFSHSKTIFPWFSIFATNFRLCKNGHMLQRATAVSQTSTITVITVKSHVIRSLVVIWLWLWPSPSPLRWWPWWWWWQW